MKNLAELDEELSELFLGNDLRYVLLALDRALSTHTRIVMLPLSELSYMRLESVAARDGVSLEEALDNAIGLALEKYYEGP